MIKVLCVLLLVALCAARPSPPAIPSTFHARVRAIMYSGSAHHRDSWKGAGLFALDVEKGFARTDIHLWGDKEPTRINIHTLDRYDVEQTYVIDNHNQKCQKKQVVGKLANPLLWVQNSSFAGESEYMGQTLENFEFQDGTVYRKIAVKKGTNEPVIFMTRSAESEMMMTVKEWSSKPSPQWARYIPSTCINENNIGDIPGVVYFANNNWDCYDVACDQTVPAGSGQPNYACAEFVARCEAYGGFIPNIGATDPQGSYYSYSYNGNSYDLCWCSDLSSALGALGFTQLSASYSSVDAGVATFGDGGDGYFSHAVIGVGPQTVDAHNNARLQIAVSDDLINGVDAAWAPPGSPPSTGSSTGSYYSTQMEAASQKETFGGEGYIYNKGEKTANSEDLTLVEEKAANKFKF